ncbi:hypothetical protein B0T18DRAFT_415674 [Schizothecium vesticola]|uniref:Uncharacterized protein n=1 Tax=Schizothecium vesticola TaxID=314040 RepID=A0AA40EQJ2_9PEZI|nr:hypothetical protein B0T18DRAFT_415674 [Schizothecium vesticola]
MTWNSTDVVPFVPSPPQLPNRHPPSLLTTGPLPSFLSARASFSFPWREQYDQAGLLLAFHPPSPSNPKSPSPARWIKTGVEFYNGCPMLSTVSCDRWADWSVTPLPLAQGKGDGEVWTTVSVEKQNLDGHGWSLWVFQILEDGGKVPLREICWVSAMAARPEKEVEDGEGLVVRVRGMDVVWK